MIISDRDMGTGTKINYHHHVYGSKTTMLGIPRCASPIKITLLKHVFIAFKNFNTPSN